MSTRKSIAIIGGGPAGLRAAEVAAAAGAAVTLYDGKRSVGRKFLMAGKSGLNLTNAAEFEEFVASYSGHEMPSQWWRRCLAEFDSAALREWAAGLGIETFATPSKKIFPTMMKAAPLLRRWVERLRTLGVEMAMNHRWAGLQHLNHLNHLQHLNHLNHLNHEEHEEHEGHEGHEGHERHEDDETLHPNLRALRALRALRGSSTPRGSSAPRSPQWRVLFQNGATREHHAVVLAMGGGSWPETGSDGGWVSILESLGIAVSPLRPANCGWEAAWTPETRLRVEGKPLLNVHIRAGHERAIGEVMLTRYGIQGTLIYALGRALRGMESPEIHLDLKPTFSIAQLVEKMRAVPRNFIWEAPRCWKLPDAACALLEQLYPPFSTAEALARAVKDCRIPLLAPRPLAEAISTAGGVRWSELDDLLMLKKLPGIYCAGEMLDWEAPTGGFLLQACFATGTLAGRAAGRQG